MVFTCIDKRSLMASTIVSLSLLFLLCSTFMPSKSHSINSTNAGFTISIIHRDSPESPLYNPYMTLHETRTAQLHRSISRIKHLYLRASAFSQSNNNNPPNTSGSTKLFYDPKLWSTDTPSWWRVRVSDTSGTPTRIGHQYDTCPTRGLTCPI